jgi:hypothetical protein
MQRPYRTGVANATLYTATSVFLLVMRMQNKIFGLGLGAELDDCEKWMEPWEAQLQAASPIILFSDQPKDSRKTNQEVPGRNGSQ